MNLDCKVCYCFHVNRNKLLNFIRWERPGVPSQLSGRGGAGTGCGWCIPAALLDRFIPIRALSASGPTTPGGPPCDSVALDVCCG